MLRAANNNESRPVAISIYQLYQPLRVPIPPKFKLRETVTQGVEHPKRDQLIVTISIKRPRVKVGRPFVGKESRVVKNKTS